MANVCEHCKRSMSSHDNHALCPQCRMAAGECSLDSENPCTTCKVWTRRQWGKLRRSLIDARARFCQRGRQHWSAAFPQLKAWIQSKPASTSASEISSQAGEGDFRGGYAGGHSRTASHAGFGSAGSKWGQYGVGYGHHSTQYVHYGTQYGTPASSRA